jgi:hypothetical protein
VLASYTRHADLRHRGQAHRNASRKRQPPVRISVLVHYIRRNAAAARHARIRAPARSPAGDFAHSCNILIGTDGKFAIQGFSAGEYTIAVRRAKQVANSAGPLAPAYIGYATVRLIDKDAQVEIPIDETGEIAGKVVVTNPGEEIDAFKPFFVSVESRQLNIHSSSNVDDDGNFRLGPFPVGPPYTVNAGVTGRAAPPFYLKHVECDGQDYSNRTITIPPGNHVVNCTLTLANDRP